ncbi:MAG: V-type ATP synthase subunit E [Chlamydiales bacterium]
MVKSLQQGQNKIQEICEALKKDTLEPALMEKERIIQEAQAQAEKILKEAHQEAGVILKEVREKIAQERDVFETALQRSSEQALETLKQKIENELFNRELDEQLENVTTDPKIIAKLIESMVKAIEKEGSEADLVAVIPDSVDPQKVTALLSKNTLKKLSKEGVQIGGFKGGAEVKLKGKQLTVEMTERVLKELLASSLRKDFREKIFAV